MTPPFDRQHLLFDADDTLWENNIHFERAFDDFVAFLQHEHLTPDEIRAIFNEIEHETVATLGYGARGFAHSLRQAYIRITGDDDANTLHTVEGFGLRILEMEIEMMAGVIETLGALRPHHDLVLVTKGHQEEQAAKLARAPVHHLFDDRIITDEKKPETYRDLVDALGFDVARTWMIGNSPRSDINPALEAGLHAVFIPHPMTWSFEQMDIADHPEWRARFHEVERFEHLTRLFRHSPRA